MNKEKPVLVTGVSGFVGLHAAAELLRRGYRVRGTLRSMARGAALQDILTSQVGSDAQITFVEADLMKDAGWGDAARGCEAVLHIASPLPTSTPKNPDDLIIPARDGTLRVLKAAREAAVSRVVITSSNAAIAYGHAISNTGPFDESTWTDVDGPDTSAYVISKTLAERSAWDFISAEGNGLELTTINPSLILGPVLEKDYGASAELVKKLLNGDFPGCPKLAFPIVDVRDVVDLHIRAMESPRAAGERYVASGETLWMKQVADLLRQHYPAYEKKLPSRELPNWLVRIFALFDKETRSVIHELGYFRQMNSSKAVQQLGWQPRSAEDAVTATADSLMALGIVQA